jgi:hypothetical protein
MTTIAAALTDLLEPSVPLEFAVRRHFSDDYRQRTNGTWDNRSKFADHIAHLRTVVRKCDIEVVNELESGPHYAERHIVRIIKRDGGTVVQEVYVFGERDADGRFTRIEETTLMLAGTDADRSIGNAR